MSFTRKPLSRKGFTLTEIAIVLGIIGLILGAIWVAATSVYSNQKVSKASSQLLTVAQGVRSIYATSAVTGSGADGDDLTEALCNAGVFPRDTVTSTTCSSTAIKNPWNGTTTVTSASTSASNTGDAFVIKFDSVPTAGCISLMTAVGGLNHESGLLYVGTSAYAMTPTNFPITIPDASTACDSKSTTHTVYLAFELKG